MADTKDPDDDGSEGDGNAAPATPSDSGPQPPQAEPASDAHNQQVQANRDRYIYGPTKAAVKWLDGHNGAVMAVATVVIMIATIANVWVVDGQLEEMRSSDPQTDKLIGANVKLAAASADNATIQKDAQRAWISPAFIRLDGAVERDKPIPVRVTYENTGRQPARDFAYLSDPGALKVAPDFADWEHIDVGENTTCSTLSPHAGSNVVYPSAHFANEIAFTASFGDFHNQTVDDIIGRDRVFWVKGCFAYKTFNEPHHSGYCYFLQPEKDKPIQSWVFRSCPTGNSTD